MIFSGRIHRLSFAVSPFSVQSVTGVRPRFLRVESAARNLFREGRISQMGYSQRKAVCGSTRATRSAGIQQASRAMVVRKRGTAVKVTAS